MRLPIVFCAASTLLAAEVLTSAATIADVIHRYSFNSDASDSVGNADTTLHGGASVSGGKLILDGVDDYASLPVGATIAAANSISIEGWVTVSESRTWTRLFDFGSSTNEYLYMTNDAAGADGVKFAITNSGIGGEQALTTTDAFPVNAETHYVLTLNADTDVMSFYLNGNLVAQQTGVTLKPSDLGTTVNNYLGRSQFNDPFLIGSISEFRIHDDALTAPQVQASFAAGPQQSVPEPGMVPLILCLGAGNWYRRRRKPVADAA